MGYYGIYDKFWAMKRDFIKAQIDREFFVRVRKDEIRNKLFRLVKERMLTPVPIHYEYIPPDYIYGKEAKIVPNGRVSLDQTLGHFLSKEYNGTYTPPGEEDRKCDYKFPVFGDSLGHYGAEIAADLIFQTSIRLVETEFGPPKIPKYRMAHIFSRYWDGFYETIFVPWLNMFGEYQCLIEFLGIENILLKDILLMTDGPDINDLE